MNAPVRGEQIVPKICLLDFRRRPFTEHAAFQVKFLRVPEAAVWEDLKIAIRAGAPAEPMLQGVVLVVDLIAKLRKVFGPASHRQTLWRSCGKCKGSLKIACLLTLKNLAFST